MDLQNRVSELLFLRVKVKKKSFNQIQLSAEVKIYTHKKMKFSIKDFFSKCDQIRRKLRIYSHLLKKFLMENFIFCAVKVY